MGTDPSAGLLISGDYNLLDLKALLSVECSLRQIVTFPTRGNRTLDIVVTNMSGLYGVPEPLPPLQPDDPAHAEPSDHAGVLVHPLQTLQYEVRTKEAKVIRRFPESKMNTFGQIVGSESWSFLCPRLNPSQL